MSLIRSHILVCTGTGCTSSESPKIIAEFEKQLAAQGMDKEAQVVRTGCFGLCALGPIVTIYPEGACYTHVTVDDVEEIVSEHIVKGRIVKRLLNRNEGGDGPATSLAETRFYKHQHRIALRNCGVINPESIDEYIGVATPPWVKSSPNTSRPSRSSTPCWPPACGAGAARASPRAKSGSSPPTRSAPTGSSMCAATPTRAIPARSWTARCWRATPTPFWRP